MEKINKKCHFLPITFVQGNEGHWCQLPKGDEVCGNYIANDPQD